MRLIFAIILIFAIVHCASASNTYMDMKWNASTREVMSGMAVADLDSDGDYEIAAAGSADGKVYLFDHEGKTIWEKDVFAYINTVGLADIDGDGVKDIVAGHADLTAFDLKGERILKYNTPQGMGIYELVFTDLDKDGIEEIVFTSFDKDDCNKQRPSAIYAVNGDTKQMIWRYTLDSDLPYAIKARDINQDGVDEIIVGVIYRSTGTNKVCTKVYNHESYVLALNAMGEMLWKTPTEGGAMAIDAGDVTESPGLEIVAGSVPSVYLISSGGEVLWRDQARLTSYAEDVHVADLDGDGKSEVYVGSDNVYALDAKGALMWTGLTDSRVYTLTSSDVDGDKKREIVAGSGSVYLFASDGKQLYQSPSHTSYGYLAAADVDGAGDDEIIAGSVRTVFMFQTAEYASKVRASRLYESAVTHFNTNPDFAIEEFIEAKRLFSELGQIDQVTLCINQIDRLKDKGGKVEDLRDEADRALLDAKNAIDMQDFLNGTRFAYIARSKYSSLNAPAMTDECDNLIESLKTIITTNASNELLAANESFHNKDYEAALDHARRANQYYTFVGDLDRAEKSSVLAQRIADILGIELEKQTVEKPSPSIVPINPKMILDAIPSINPMQALVALGFLLAIILVSSLIYFAFKMMARSRAGRSRFRRKRTIANKQLEPNIEPEEQEIPNGLLHRHPNVVKYEPITENEVRIVLEPNKGIFRAQQCRQGLCIRKKRREL